MQAGQGQFAGRLALGDPGEGAQVLDRQADDGLFGGAFDLIFGHFLGDAADDGRALGHPGGDEVGADVGRPVQHGVDPAAVGMAHDDDAAHVQHLDPELQRRRHPVQQAVRLVGRDQIGDVAYYEQLAGRRVEDQGRIGAAVGTGDDQGVRLLAQLGQGFVLGTGGGPVLGAEPAVSGGEFVVDVAHDSPVASLQSGLNGHEAARPRPNFSFS